MCRWYYCDDFPPNVISNFLQTSCHCCIACWNVQKAWLAHAPTGPHGTNSQFTVDVAPELTSIFVMLKETQLWFMTSTYISLVDSIRLKPKKNGYKISDTFHCFRSRLFTRNVVLRVGLAVSKLQRCICDVMIQVRTRWLASKWKIYIQNKFVFPFSNANVLPMLRVFFFEKKNRRSLWNIRTTYLMAAWLFFFEHINIFVCILNAFSLSLSRHANTYPGYLDCLIFKHITICLFPSKFLDFLTILTSEVRVHLRCLDRLTFEHVN